MAVKYSSIGGGSGTGFNVQVGSQYSYATFTQAQPAGAYTIKSSNNYTNWDVYLLDASNNLVAYTGSASIAPTTAFSAIVVVNGTLNDILQFSFASTVFSTATTSQTKAGPFITAFGSSVIPSINSAVTITGGNFAVGITATFTGTDSVVRTCKSVVYTSSSSISVVRPDVLPIAYVPYVLTLTNPGINNQATSGKNILTGLTVGNAPVWSTATSLPTASGGTAYSTTLIATDVEGAVTYSYVSGALPAGLSFNASTGVISGTYSSLTDGSTSYTVRATDNGGNYTDRTFTLAYTGVGGGTLSSDATYYYRTFFSNGTLTGANGLTADVLVVAGGGGGGRHSGGGGGAGGVAYKPAATISSGSITIAVGAGGAGRNTGTYPTDPGGGGAPGIDTTFGSFYTANGGGYGGYYGLAGGNGGSGGGSGRDAANGAAATQPSSATGGYGNSGGTNQTSSLGNGPGYPGHGGGGAGQAGGLGTATGGGGKGGDGLNTWSSWAPISALGQSGYIAGGGGGNIQYSGYGNPGAGGAGGGGAGGDGSTANSGAGANGVANTGSGGGGSRYDGLFGDSNRQATGGSGIVIVRYTRAQVGGQYDKLNNK